MAKLGLLATCLLVAACDSDSGGVQEINAGDGLTGGGAGTVNLAVDFNQVARKTHAHAFSELTGVPNASTSGAKCAAGQKATGVNVAMGTVSCEADTDTDTLGALDCPDGQVAQFKSGAWGCGALSGGGGGTVTSVATGAGLQGGPITGSGTLSVDFSTVAAANHTHPDPWFQETETTLLFDGFIGLGRSPTAAIDVDSEQAELLLHDRAGGNSAAVLLEDTDNTGETLNLTYQRTDGNTVVTSATIFMGGDDSLAYQTDGAAHRFKVSASQEAMRIAETGNVGIGTPTPAHKLEVSNGVTTAFCDGTNWVNASSRAAKEGIRAFADDDYRAIRKLLDETQVVWYRYRNDRDPRTRVGLIAEDVPAVLATADRKGISTADAIGFLTAATKELASENERLARENGDLQARLARLEARLMKLEKGR